MKAKTAVLSLCLLFVLSLVASCGPPTARNDTWKVTVYSAEHKRVDTGVTSSVDGIALYLNIEYLGPDAEVELPQVYLRDGRNNTPAIGMTLAPGQSMTKEHLSWLDSLTKGQRVSIDLTKGFKLDPEDTGKFCFLFDPESEGTEYDLVVGDVPPIKITIESDN